MIAERGEATVSVADLQAKLAQMEPRMRTAFLSDPKQINKTVENLLILRQLAAEVDATEAERNAILRARIQQAREEALAVHRLDQIRAERASGKLDQLAREYYLTHPDEMKAPAQATVRHILVEIHNDDEAAARKKIEEIAAAAKGASIDAFAELVLEHSDDPSKTANGGLIPVVENSTELDPMFAAAAIRLGASPVGSISEPVRTQFGFHLMQLVSGKPSAPLDFETVKPSLIEKLREDLRRSVVVEYRAEVMSRAETKFFPENLTEMVYADDPLSLDKVAAGDSAD